MPTSQRCQAKVRIEKVAGTDKWIVTEFPTSDTSAHNHGFDESRSELMARRSERAMEEILEQLESEVSLPPRRTRRTADETWVNETAAVSDELESDEYAPSSPTASQGDNEGITKADCDEHYPLYRKASAEIGALINAYVSQSASMSTPA